MADRHLELLELATEVQSTLQSLTNDRDPAVRAIEDWLSARCAHAKCTFPQNWCDFAACVLAGHIARNFSDDTPVCIVKASDSRSGHPHWWVRQVDIDIDITCNQFEGSPPSPLVASRSAWHANRFIDADAVGLSRRPLMCPEFEVLGRALESRVDEQTSRSSAVRCLARSIERHASR